MPAGLMASACVAATALALSEFALWMSLDNVHNVIK